MTEININELPVAGQKVNNQNNELSGQQYALTIKKPFRKI